MLFVLPTPSLEQVAGIKIVTALWNRADILNSILREHLFTRFTDTLDWDEIAQRVEANLSALPLPNQIKKQLKSFIKPIGVDICKWFEYHTDDFRYDSEWLTSVSPRQFQWTMRGTVDYKKTAESIVNNETVDVEKRYIVACVNCLEDEARRLIQHLSADQKTHIVRDARQCADGIQTRLEIYFTCTLNGWPATLRQHFRLLGGYRRSESIPERLFKESLGCGDRSMWEYLFQKLNPRERENVFRESQDLLHGSWNVYFLSLMSEEQQELAFGQSTEKILECLLRWPTQSLFLEAAERGWRFMNMSSCTNVFLSIAENITSNNVDYDYSHLYRECWRLSPSNDQRWFLEYFFDMEDFDNNEKVEFIKLVLDEALPSQVLALGERCRDDDRLRERLTENDTFHAALKECRAKAELESSNDGSAEEKENSHLKCEYLEQLAEFLEDGGESP